MGYKTMPTDFGDVWTQPGIFPYEDIFRMHGQLIRVTILKFHTSYDWLMPVVDKIELILKDEGGFYLDGWNCYIETGEVRIDSHPSPESRLHSIYHTVCEFIKIYNERS